MPSILEYSSLKYSFISRMTGGFKIKVCRFWEAKGLARGDEIEDGTDSRL